MNKENDNKNMEEFKVTPYEVRGEVDYEKLIKEFGADKIDSKLKKRIKKDFGELHYMLRRGYFFSHRDFDKILKDYEKEEDFYLYTGRGPSGKTHLGHLAPWVFTKYLQEKTGKKLLFQITDDEKFLTKDLSLDQVKKYTKENILDIIAVGFDPEKTEIIVDTKNAKTLYNEAIKVAKRITFSTVRNTFGFQESDNIGKIFFTAMQSVPAFLESKKKGKNIRCLIPLAIGQDPHFRLSRDVAPKLGYLKPSIIHAKFLPSLQGPKTKMSSSKPKTCIFTTDGPEEIDKKIDDAFTGGRDTAEEQREKGGQPEICPIFLYEHYLLEKDDKTVKKHAKLCRKGEMLCGEHKEKFKKKVKKFLKKHQKKREKAKDKVEEFLIED